MFARSGAAWTQQAYLEASNPDAADQFGRSLALSADGTTLAVGADGEASITTGFGNAVALSGDGTTLVVAAPLEDSASTDINGSQINDLAADRGAAYVFE